MALILMTALSAAYASPSINQPSREDVSDPSSPYKSYGPMTKVSIWNKSFPKEIEKTARDLQRVFENRDIQELYHEQILGTLCVKNDCGGLEEEQASKIFDLLVQQTDKNYGFWATWLTVFLTGASLLVSLLAYRQSSRNERGIGALQSDVGALQRESTDRHGEEP